MIYDKFTKFMDLMTFQILHSLLNIVMLEACSSCVATDNSLISTNSEMSRFQIQAWHICSKYGYCFQHSRTSYEKQVSVPLVGLCINCSCFYGGKIIIISESVLPALARDRYIPVRGTRSRTTPHLWRFAHAHTLCRGSCYCLAYS